MRDSERDAINAIHAADVAGAKAKLEAAQRRVEEIDKDGNRKWDRYLESAPPDGLLWVAAPRPDIEAGAAKARRNPFYDRRDRPPSLESFNACMI